MSISSGPSVVELHFREYGRPVEGQPSLIFLHGLFGSSANWHSIARRLEARLHLMVPDLRNHGRSPHEDAVDYPAMAADVLGVMDGRRLDQAMLIGHSMGAKVAMWLALEQPQRVDRLMAVDMAPVRYKHGFDSILSALQDIDPDRLAGRSEAEALLVERLDNRMLAQYLLQNLGLQHGRYHWRMNLGALTRGVGSILDFPEVGDRRFPGKAWFVYGGQSDYVTPAYNGIITELFPHARLRMVAGAGHWVYAEKPEEFSAVVDSFVQDP